MQHDHPQPLRRWSSLLGWHESSHAGVGPLRADEHSEFSLVTATAKTCGSLSDADRDSRSASVQ